jgi:hypothetical protein
VFTFQWRLAVRPESSAAEIADTSSSSMMVVPDVAGAYSIELRVSDGELWSQPAMLAMTAR